MKKLVTVLAGATMALVAHTSAHALLITGPSNPYTVGSGNPEPECKGDNGGPDATFLSGCGYAGYAQSDLIYGATPGTGESGSHPGAYSFTYSGAANDDINNLTISWSGGAAADCSAAATLDCLLIVKDGSATYGRYLYNLTTMGWNGTDDIILQNFWVGPQGSISHVGLFGSPGEVCTVDCGPDRDVPEPGTVALVGLALAGLGATKRARRS